MEQAHGCGTATLEMLPLQTVRGIGVVCVVNVQPCRLDSNRILGNAPLLFTSAGEMGGWFVGGGY